MSKGIFLSHLIKLNTVHYPDVKELSSLNREPFSDYYLSLPDEIQKNIPEEILENWVYRHRDGGFEEWIELQPETWAYQKIKFSNEMISEIDHVGTWMEELRLEGREFVEGGARSKHFVGQYMLKTGTFPSPILVAHECEHIIHPRMPGNATMMKSPYQLIEGHRRLACLLGMIESGHKNLKSEHEVWLINIPRSNNYLEMENEGY